MEDYSVPLETPCVYFEKDLLSQEEANAFYQDLHKNTKFEKTVKINRWVALHEDDNTNTKDEGGTTEGETLSQYKYRDAPGQSEGEAQPKRPFTAAIKAICEKAEAWYNSKHPDKASDPVKFNVCLLNYYEDGNQRIGWHSDREEIGRTTPIASISLGASREFQIRAKEGLERTSITVTNGSLVIMENVCQLKYVHCLPKMLSVTEGRINLTFRCKTENTPGEEEHDRRDNWLARIAEIHSSSAGEGSYPTYSEALMAPGEAGEGRNTPVFGDMTETEEELDTKLKATKVVFTVKANLGTELYAAAEIDELLNSEGSDKLWVIIPRPWGVAGYTAVGRPLTSDEGDNASDIDEDMKRTALDSLLKLRSTIHVMEYHDHFDLFEVAASKDPKINVEDIDGEDLYQFYKQRLLDGRAKIPTLETGTKKKKTTFRASCERIGSKHNFKSDTVEFEVGGAMSEYFANIKPKMEDFDVNIRVDVVANHVIVGTQQNFTDLSKRHFARYRNLVTIKSNLAYCMLRCANLQPDQVILDPFCGSGTILLEALEVEPSVRCVGIDVNRRSIQGAQENAKAEGRGADVLKFHCIDVRAFRKHVPDNSVDAIVSNLPWGIMTGQRKSVSDLQSMYEMFLRTAWYTLKDHGRVVMLVLRGLQVTRIARKLGGRYRLLRANVVRTTNNLPCIVILEKVPQDIMNYSIKGQLAFMSQFVNVSKDIYHAIHNEDIAQGVDVPTSARRSDREDGDTPSS